MSGDVRAAFDAMDVAARDPALQLRELIFDVADNTPEIGPIEEVLRWGQPSYITPKKKAASTLRLGVPENGTFAIFAHCQSSVISDYVALFPDQDRVEGNRAILFDTADQIDPKRHGLLIKSALTYHL